MSCRFSCLWQTESSQIRDQTSVPCNWGQIPNHWSTRKKVKEKKVKLLSHVPLFATPWTVAHQAPLSMGFSRQEYWSGLPFPSPGDLPNTGIEPGSPEMQADSLPSKPLGEVLNFFFGAHPAVRQTCLCFNSSWSEQSRGFPSSLWPSCNLLSSHHLQDYLLGHPPPLGPANRVLCGGSLLSSTMSSQICQIYSTDMETAAHHPVNQRLGVSGLLHVPLWASTSTATTWLWRMWAASFCQLVKNCEGSKQL